MHVCAYADACTRMRCVFAFAPCGILMCMHVLACICVCACVRVCVVCDACVFICTHTSGSELMCEISAGVMLHHNRKIIVRVARCYIYKPGCATYVDITPTCLATRSTKALYMSDYRVGNHGRIERCSPPSTCTLGHWSA